MSHISRNKRLKCLRIICLLLMAACIWIRFPRHGRAQARGEATATMTSASFFYPLGTASWTKTGGTWLGRDGGRNADGTPHDTDGPPAYISGLYHLGVDMPANADDSVYAVTNGTVWSISQNGWGTGNVAVILKHTLDNGTEFLAIYGHIRPTNGLKVGDRVAGGVKFAIVGPYPEGGEHLHFGVHPAVAFPLLTSTIGWVVPQIPGGQSETDSWIRLTGLPQHT